MKTITAIVLGAGGRGCAYADYSLNCPEELKIVGVAEPRADRRELFAKKYHVPEGNCFSDWKEILALPKMADAVFVCTMDEMHTEPAILAMEKGYDVLLEKPMSNTKEECIAIEQAVQRTGRALIVGHVLRYTSFYATLKKLVSEGAVGEIATIDQIENVGYWHQAHRPAP